VAVLQIVAGGGARGPALGIKVVERAGRAVEARAAPSAPAVDADVETGPVVEGGRDYRSLDHGRQRGPRQVGGNRRCGREGERHAGAKDTFHAKPPLLRDSRMGANTPDIVRVDWITSGEKIRPQRGEASTPMCPSSHPRERCRAGGKMKPPRGLFSSCRSCK